MVRSADLLIVYGDIVFEPRVVRAILGEDAPLATAIDRSWYRYWSLRMDDPLADAETLRLSPDGRILELGKRPSSLGEIDGQYMGLSKVRADHVERFERAWAKLDPSGSYDGRDKPNMYMTSFFSMLIADGWYLKAVPVEGGWLEVDSTSDLDLYHRLLRTGELATFYDPTWPVAA
jgi:choline kinase